MGNELLDWISVLHEPGEIVEIRSVSKPTLSGYFPVGSMAIVEQVKRYPSRTFYQTLQPINPACSGREQNGVLMQIRDKQPTTGDADVVGYSWILIDCDPERIAGVSATDDEKHEAKLTAKCVHEYLRNQGFEEPVICDSGNGYHLLYHVQAEKKSFEPVLKRFLGALDLMFTTDKVKIDTTVFNPSRITKLYGTIATKGQNTPDRPHRYSGILRVPYEIKCTSIQLVMKVAEALPEPDRKASGYASNYQHGEKFDVRDFLARHNVRVKREMGYQGGTKFVLEECPFNASHKAPDSIVYEGRDGRFGFKCSHNSCSEYHWHDFRELFEPEAYEQKYMPARQYTEYNRLHSSSQLKQMEQVSTDGSPIIIDIADIEAYDRTKIVVVKSGFPTLDGTIGGFNKGELSIWSGGNGAGKSSVVSQLGITAVDQGLRVLYYSGEMRDSVVKHWMYLQAAGRDMCEVRPSDPIHPVLKPNVFEYLNDKLRGKIFIYNNDFGSDWIRVRDALIEHCDKHSIDVLMLDNLMSLSLPGVNADKYEVQSVIVKELAALAKQKNIHVHFICHPRKTQSLYRKDDISGTADLSNAADNVFMVHRANADFSKRIHEIYPKYNAPDDFDGNVIEIMKNRDSGIVDKLIMLYFEPKTKSFSELKGGRPVFEWSNDIINQCTTRSIFDD